MNKNTFRYLVDTLMFVSMTGTIFIGVLMGFFLAEGPVKNEAAKYFLGLHRHQWGHIHLYLSLAFLLFLVLHLVLEWKWITCTAAKIFKGAGKTALLGTVGLSFLILFFFWLWTPKYADSYKEFGRGDRLGLSLETAGEQGQLILTGQMTLADVENITGIPTGRIIEALGWPSSTGTDVTLGWLKRERGFDMVDLRDRIYALMDVPPAGLSAPEEGERKDPPPQSVSGLSETRAADEHEEKTVRGLSAEGGTGILITGRMTFRDIGKHMGVNPGILLERLGLPDTTPLDESLGRLRRIYEFTLPQIRDVLAEMMDKS